MASVLCLICLDLDPQASVQMPKFFMPARRTYYYLDLQQQKTNTRSASYPNHIWLSDYLLTASHAALCILVFLNASVTAFLHWLTRPYVGKLVWQPAAESFEVEVISWWGGSLPRTTIKFANIRDPESFWPILWFQPDDLNLFEFYAKTKCGFGYFKVNGRFYFLKHEHFHNKELLAKLTTFTTCDQ